MKKFGKKSLIITLCATAAAIGITAGGVFAQDDEPAPGDRQADLLEKVCAIYEDNTGVAIDADELSEAFKAAQEEMRDEAQAEHLARLVEEGVITEDEAAEIEEWLNSRPEIDFLQGHFPGGGPAGRFGPRQGGCPGMPGVMGPWGENAPEADATNSA